MKSYLKTVLLLMGGFFLMSCSSVILDIDNLEGGSRLGGECYKVFNNGTLEHSTIESDELVAKRVDNLRWTDSNGIVFDFDESGVIVFHFDVNTLEWYCESAETGQIIRNNGYDYDAGINIHVNKINWKGLRKLEQKYQDNPTKK